MSRARGASVRYGVLGLLCALLGLSVMLGRAPGASAAGDANVSASCPAAEGTPGFRSFMPDCRAYELVTPPYGGGQPAYGIEHRPPQMTADGERLLGVSFAGFAETGNLEQSGFEYGAVYQFSRSATGWLAEALDPPAAEYPRRNFILASAGLNRSLWELAVPATAGEEIGIVESGYNGWQLAIREDSGRFVAVGPLVAPGHSGSVSPGSVALIGASADLSHVFVRVTNVGGQLWPGDETLAGDQSLYEYDGAGSGEPVLVGVSNQGRLDGSPHVNEGASLVSDCGTLLGSSNISTAYNAVSSDGEVVFFTALECAGGPAANELYARVAAEKTLDLSEPPLSGPESVPGRECTGTCESDELTAADHAAAVFQGASSDGTKVFFTTEQPLVNSAVGGGNCLYEATIAGAGAQAHVASLVRVASDVPAVARVSEDGTRIYYESTDDVAGAAEAGGYNLYAYDTDTGQTSFVANLMTQAEASGLTTAEIEGQTGVSVLDKSSQTEGGRPFEATRDGQYLVFLSARDLTGPEDTSTVLQLFEYDAATETLVRVSRGQTVSGLQYECPATKVFEEGFDCNGNTGEQEYSPLMVLTPAFQGASVPTAATSDLSVSENGVVVFASPLTLTPQAVPSRVVATSEGVVEGRTENLYEYSAGNVYLISPADESGAIQVRHREGLSRLYGIDESGKDIFFATTDNLVPQDTDTQQSWYDAREEGGFPTAGLAPGCVGTTCQGPLSPAPELPAAGGTAVTLGGTNLPPAPSASAKPKTAAEVKAEKLKKALKACASERDKKKRRACEAQAREKYGTKHKKSAKKATVRRVGK